MSEAGGFSGLSGENITHFGGIRLRVTGRGNLKATFYSLDNVDSQALAVIPMSLATAIEPFRLANFITQRAFLRLETTELDETFKFNRIIVYAKPLYTSHPQ